MARVSIILTAIPIETHVTTYVKDQNVFLISIIYLRLECYVMIIYFSRSRLVGFD
jgi:heme/copper-type cytochrome/quinol oxidase subunit 4